MEEKSHKFLAVEHDSSRKFFSNRDKETFEMQNGTKLGPGRKPVRNGRRLECEAEVHIPATHTVRRITEELRSKHILVIKLPSQSPELNPIQKCWQDLMFTHRLHPICLSLSRFAKNRQKSVCMWDTGPHKHFSLYLHLQSFRSMTQGINTNAYFIFPIFICKNLSQLHHRLPFSSSQSPTESESEHFG